ncbi:MAG: preprotein translocase subunit SecG [Gammaproteobacteria bacterium RIFCSPHIGHO2_12_FULL_38_11]|nr:MAG: preprotein translocase subunit SecG [Gammaproteobacteria bacterium RIFCSPHIGHO2_12_FULL_38_11]
MQQLILVIHVLAALSIIGLVLMQHGRGADVGASFGSGSSNTMFGSVGALPFLMKLTTICAATFFITSLSLSYLAAHNAHKSEAMVLPAALTAQPAKAPVSNSDSNAGLMFAPVTKK